MARFHLSMGVLCLEMSDTLPWLMKDYTKKRDNDLSPWANSQSILRTQTYGATMWHGSHELTSRAV